MPQYLLRFIYVGAFALKCAEKKFSFLKPSRKMLLMSHQGIVNSSEKKFNWIRALFWKNLLIWLNISSVFFFNLKNEAAERREGWK